MSGLEDLGLKEFQEIVRSIRSSSDYSDTLDVIKEKLGLPNKVVDFEIEALLIMATREKFKENLDADMTLMALGLLEDFPNLRNAEDQSGIRLIRARREMFIWTSSYVADRHSSSNKRRKAFYESCEELEAAGEDALEDVISALGSDESRRINQVAKRIYVEKRTINEYLGKAKEYLIYDVKGNILDVKLQELKNKRKKITIDTQNQSLTPAEEIQDSGETEEQESKEPREGHGDEPIEPELPEPTPPSVDSWGKARTIAFNLCIFLIALVIISGVIDFVSVRLAISSALKSAEQEPALVSIRFDNPFEYLSFGDDLNLTVIPTPSDAALKGLKCKSSAPNIVEIKSESALHIKAAEASKNSKTCDVDIEAAEASKNSKTCDVDIEAYMDFDNDIKDEMVIHVIKNGEIESRGKGSQTGN